MLIRRFDGTLMRVLPRPFARACGKLYEMRDAGDRLEIVREAIKLDGETGPTQGATRGLVVARLHNLEGLASPSAAFR